VIEIFLPSKVDVLPPQVEQLAATCSGISSDVEEGEQSVSLCGAQERLELREGPDGTWFLGLRPWPLRLLDRVVAN
jgi:hypothetical protein